MIPVTFEAYTRINEKAKISGVALIPRISRNNNLYTKAELMRFDNKTVPLNWEHDPDQKIGKVTFHYNSALETLYYDGVITDEAAANLARNKTLFTSIEATPEGAKEICNEGEVNDCFSMPFGLKPKGLALTETPGVPETSVQVIDNYIRECQHELNTGLDYTNIHDVEKKVNEILKNLILEECNECGEYKPKEEYTMQRGRVYTNCPNCGEPKEGCADCHNIQVKKKKKEDVNLAGPQSRADIAKKKKKDLNSKNLDKSGID